MKDKLAVDKLERLVKNLFRENPTRIHVALGQQGQYELKYGIEDQFTQLEGSLGGTVMPGSVLTKLSYRPHPGYSCNTPLPVRGRAGFYELQYIRLPSKST